ncbi:hypothetical protein QQF64_002126 [Cirrhinus molitorella]|uniref:Uncharacterized protein n=1 Tax=Cirrhinus molitorella TaxID=172907 RepID=A0ABR3MPA4_9TELE
MQHNGSVVLKNKSLKAFPLLRCLCSSLLFPLLNPPLSVALSLLPSLFQSNARRRVSQSTEYARGHVGGQTLHRRKILPGQTELEPTARPCGGQGGFASTLKLNLGLIQLAPD